MTGRAVEREGRTLFERYLKSLGWLYEFIDADEPDGLALQMRGVDYILDGPSVKGIELELKTEQKFTGNLFLESWADAWNAEPGWLLTINPDILACLFLDVNKLFLMNFADLKGWYFGSGRFVSAKRVRVNAHPTGRYTIGHLVRIPEVARNIDIIEIDLHAPLDHKKAIESLIHHDG